MNKKFGKEIGGDIVSGKKTFLSGLRPSRLLPKRKNRTGKMLFRAIYT